MVDVIDGLKKIGKIHKDNMKWIFTILSLLFYPYS